MAEYLFVAQDMLDDWITQGKIFFTGKVMSIKGQSNRYKLEDAVRFVEVEDKTGDRLNLLGRVKSLEQVADEGGERVYDSVVYDGIAYRVQNGYIARVHVPDELAVASREVAEERRDGEPMVEERADISPASNGETVAEIQSNDSVLLKEESDHDVMSEAEMLTQFLLKNLR